MYTKLVSALLSNVSRGAPYANNAGIEYSFLVAAQGVSLIRLPIIKIKTCYPKDNERV